MVPPHCFVARNHILKSSRFQVMNSGATVCRRGTFIKHKLALGRILLQGFLKDILFLPALEHLFFHLWKRAFLFRHSDPILTQCYNSVNMEKPTIYLGADHAGWEVKEAIEAWLKTQGYNVVDMGNENLVEHDDYPEFSHAVAKRVQTDPGSLGVVACGNAQGVCIVANKVRGVRAATGFDTYVENLTKGR